MNWIDKAVGYIGADRARQIEQEAEKAGRNAGLKKLLYLHFTMDDNLSLAEEIKQRYRNMYIGVFFKRYILGLWAMAEGIIYDMFDEEVHVLASLKDIEWTDEYYVSCDYGTQNATVFQLWRKMITGQWVCIKEYYYSGRSESIQKTDIEYAEELVKFLGNIRKQVRAVIVDPSAASFIAQLKKDGFHVKKANNDVLDGIRLVGTLLNLKKLLFYKDCVNTIREFGTYVWDQKAVERGEDKPLKQGDHCLTGDTLVDTVDGQVPIKDLLGKKGKVHCYDVRRRRRAISKYIHVRMTQKEAVVYAVTLEDGTVIKATKEHPILTKRGWVRLKDLQKDDRVLKIST